MSGFQIWTTKGAPRSKNEFTPAVLLPTIFLDRTAAIEAKKAFDQDSYIVEYPIAPPRNPRLSSPQGG